MRITDLESIKNYNCPDSGSFTRSMNHIYWDENKDVDILIVGTLTPAKNRGYYYTSNANKMFEYLDNYYNNDPRIADIKATLPFISCEKNTFESLVDRDIELYEAKNSNEIKKIRKRISKIEFIDVFDYAIRRDRNSASDDNIIKATLDIESFGKLNHVNNVIINSKLSFDCFKSIVFELGIENRFDNIYCLPQTGRSYCKTIRRTEDGYAIANINDAWRQLLTSIMEPSNEHKRPMYSKISDLRLSEWPPFRNYNS